MQTFLTLPEERKQYEICWCEGGVMDSDEEQEINNNNNKQQPNLQICMRIQRRTIRETGNMKMRGGE